MKKGNHKMETSLRNKREAIPKKVEALETKPEVIEIREEVIRNKAVVIKSHDGLEEGFIISESTPEIIDMMVNKGFWRYATTKDK
jgi:hypothetical protein